MAIMDRPFRAQWSRRRVISRRAEISGIVVCGRLPFDEWQRKGDAMLEIRPNCEWCDKDLPPDAPDARICSYECTYCARCVEDVLHNVCATCGGGFAPRPIRPRSSKRAGVNTGLDRHPASPDRVHSRWSRDEVDEISLRLRDIPPPQR